MIWKYPHLRTDRQPVEPLRIGYRYDAMFLVGISYAQAVESFHARRIAEIAVMGVRQKAVGADVFRKRQRPGIEDKTVAGAVMADDGGQYGDGNVVQVTDIA